LATFTRWFRSIDRPSGGDPIALAEPRSDRALALDPNLARRTRCARTCHMIYDYD